MLYEPTDEEVEAGAEVIEVPPILCQWLRPHQREGVQFVFECVYGMKDYGGTGAILADDMGLGKTLQSITLLYTLLKSLGRDGKRIAKRVIVVCPCSLVKNWQDEFEKWVNCRAKTKAERIECNAVADALSPAEQQRRGTALNRLKVLPTETVLFGRVQITLQLAGGRPLPPTKLTNGALVALKQTSSSSSKAIIVPSGRPKFVGTICACVSFSAASAM